MKRNVSIRIPPLIFMIGIFASAVLRGEDSNTHYIERWFEEVDLRKCSGSQPFVSDAIINTKLESGATRIDVVRLVDRATGKTSDFVVEGHHSASAHYLKGNFLVEATVCKDFNIYGRTYESLRSYEGTWPTQVDQFTKLTRNGNASSANPLGIISLKMPNASTPVSTQIIDIVFMQGLEINAIPEASPAQTMKSPVASGPSPSNLLSRSCAPPPPRPSSFSFNRMQTEFRSLGGFSQGKAGLAIGVGNGVLKDMGVDPRLSFVTTNAVSTYVSYKSKMTGSMRSLGGGLAGGYIGGQVAEVAGGTAQQQEAAQVFGSFGGGFAGGPQVGIGNGVCQVASLVGEGCYEAGKGTYKYGSEYWKNYWRTGYFRSFSKCYLGR